MQLSKRLTHRILQALSDFMHRMDEGNSPRWIIFSLDLIVVECSLILAFLLRFNFELPLTEKYNLLLSMGVILLVRGSMFFAFKSYAHVIRHTSTLDVIRLLSSVAAGTFMLLVYSMIARSIPAVPVLPLSVIIIEGLVSIYLMTNMRLAFKYIYRRSLPPLVGSNPVLIIGSKEKAVLTREALELDRRKRIKVVGFADSNELVNKNRLAGLPLYKLDELERIIVRNKVKSVILAKLEIQERQQEEIAMVCKDYGIKLLHAPEGWMNTESPRIEMREVNIEELLTRDPINLDKKHILRNIKGKVILVTGAAGSIGSELARQIARYKPKHVLLVDQAESPLYDLELELSEKHRFTNFTVVLADILQRVRIEKIFDYFRPDVVFHAAAYKHVPMLENNPLEAFRNNVEGTRILADHSDRFRVQKFVMISTDKAVNPTGIMGATKRIAEMYVQSLNSMSDTAFITTRFGNVLNSSGSAIPRFLSQINEGGPVTVTHPEITRFFMTIQEACQLVLEAGVMGSGGEVYLFDMGTPIKIADLAKRLIKLTGHTEDEIKIKYTGLREGEKLFEELLLESEPNIPTHHSKIMVAEVDTESYNTVRSQIAEINNFAKVQDTLNVVKLMKSMVPSYISKNSIFEKLDH